MWNNIPFEELEILRLNDNRSDDIIKKEVLNALQKNKKDILFAVDDRQQVVYMWRKNDITCLQCDIGNF